MVERIAIDGKDYEVADADKAAEIAAIMYLAKQIGRLAAKPR